VEIASLTDVLPDGLAVDTGGNLYVGCYEPSQVRRRAAVVDEDKHVKTPLAHCLLETELWGLAFATMPLSSRSLWACMRVPFPRYFFRGHAV
jgi:hypothetical protein